MSLHPKTSFVHISDTHFNIDYSASHITVLSRRTGITLTERLAIGMEHIFENCPEIDFFLLTGDIVHNGAAEEYNVFFRYFDTLVRGRAYYLALGNHDTDAFWEGYLGRRRAEEFYDYAVTEPKSGLKIIALDARGGKYGMGLLRPEQLSWLRDTVSDGRQCIILLHQTPNLGDNEYLSYQTQNPTELYGVLSGANVLGIFSGHTHFGFESMLGEIPCHTAPSITFGLESDEWSMTLTDKTGYNYCTYHDGKVTVKNMKIPDTGASLRYTYDELKAVGHF